MKPIIKKMTGLNFQGHRNIVIEPDGSNFTVYGDNAVGKTTLNSMFSWLFFGKDAHGASAFDIKTLDADGNVIPMIDHEVEAVMDINGAMIPFRRVYREKYKTTRGSADRLFDGHETSYFWNNVEVGEKGFNDKVAALCPPHLFRLLTDPTYFSSDSFRGIDPKLPAWKARRQVIQEVCGDTPDDVLFAMDDQFAELPLLIGINTLDEFRKILEGGRTRINNELKSLPARLDEASRMFRTIPAGNHANDVKLGQQLLETLRTRRTEAASGGEVARLNIELRDIESKITQRINALKVSDDPGRAAALRQQSEVTTEVRNAEEDIARRQRMIAADERELETLSQTRMQLLKRIEDIESEHAALQAKKFEYKEMESEETCPTCQQPFPAEYMFEIRAKFETDRDNNEKTFNLARASQITANRTLFESVKATGIKTRQAIDDLANEESGKIALAKAELQKALASLDEWRKLLAGITVPAPASPVEPTQDHEYKQLTKLRDDINVKLTQSRENADFSLGEIDVQIKKANDLLAVSQKIVSDIQHNKDLEARVEELKGQQKNLAKEYEELDRQYTLTEQFIRYKVQFLTEKINSRFKMARFKLFDVQINGGVNEVCEVTYNGVPYGSLNHGARINVGLDIINTLAEHYDFYPPIWIDNAESITKLIPTVGQQIRLVVSEMDKKLRFCHDPMTAAEIEEESRVRAECLASQQFEAPDSYDVTIEGVTLKIPSLAGQRKLAEQMGFEVPSPKPTFDASQPDQMIERVVVQKAIEAIPQHIVEPVAPYVAIENPVAIERPKTKKRGDITVTKQTGITETESTLF